MTNVSGNIFTKPLAKQQDQLLITLLNYFAGGGVSVTKYFSM
jgi:hypothetical protein